MASVYTDYHRYKDRDLEEKFFEKIKQFRRVAMRYERLARNYQLLLYFVSAVIWLAQLSMPHGEVG